VAPEEWKPGHGRDRVGPRRRTWERERELVHRRESGGTVNEAILK